MIAFFSLFHHLTDYLGALTDLAEDLKGIWIQIVTYKKEKKKSYVGLCVVLRHGTTGL